MRTCPILILAEVGLNGVALVLSPNHADSLVFNVQLLIEFIVYTRLSVLQEAASVIVLNFYIAEVCIALASVISHDASNRLVNTSI